MQQDCVSIFRLGVRKYRITVVSKVCKICEVFFYELHLFCQLKSRLKYSLCALYRVQDNYLLWNLILTIKMALAMLTFISEIMRVITRITIFLKKLNLH
ncbi:unnamed protein product [Acanthoscelides obtectus]|uniref:Uncharacterized protein n=1 Tax=Acanthoscelides obtectus TaxID=200917 RepID=A0A9P0PTY6_ACAOB|nr:unnamed protein product [Acanthoscelides obtectus]CAH2012018.1 unnamed protein product [Acanthoscelides obtectus]CAK1632400.1 hypothetical protein AOBTE_LOCUS7539 [Acanthoscelides obtectus]CAK1671866.1 hypothetical protein AOBTE_LOCUS28508 [Acanthoscelides obtectus]